MHKRSTIRWRLTALFGALFALSGLLLLTISFKFVSDSLEKNEGSSRQRVIDTYKFDPRAVNGFYEFPVPPSPTRPEAKTIGDVIDGVQADIRQETTHNLLVGSGIALALMLAASVGLGYLAAGRALRPVDEMTDKAKRLSERNLDERLHYDGPPDELKELADTLDGMLERLQAAFDTQRSFAASVSHELRTPLSVLKAEADLAASRDDATEEEKRFAAVVARESERAAALLESLLTLARTESTMRDHERIDLADVSGEVVSERIEAAERRGVHLDLELGPEPVIVDGDPWLLERLVANLVDNAITHNHDGGSATVEIRSVGANGSARAVIEVHNTGDVLDAEQVAKLTEPFQRADRTRPGHGLGMSIMRAVTEVHDGTFEVRPQEGGGLDVIVELPVAAGATEH